MARDIVGMEVVRDRANLRFFFFFTESRRNSPESLRLGRSSYFLMPSKTLLFWDYSPVTVWSTSLSLCSSSSFGGEVGVCGELGMSWALLGQFTTM